jgi:hypothetical protein
MKLFTKRLIFGKKSFGFYGKDLAQYLRQTKSWCLTVLYLNFNLDLIIYAIINFSKFSSNKTKN